MIRNPDIPTVTSPVLLDAAIAYLQTALTTGLTWLTTAYGKAERRERVVDGQRIIYPAAYAGGLEYLGMLPDGHLGNYCWADVPAGQEYDEVPRSYGTLAADVGLVFWFDFREVYPADWQSRTVEHVKAEVLRVLSGATMLQADFQPTAIYDRPERIYQGYTISEVDNQFLMRPFGGFRIEGRMVYKESCV